MFQTPKLKLLKHGTFFNPKVGVWVVKNLQVKQIK